MEVKVEVNYDWYVVWLEELVVVGGVEAEGLANCER